MTSDSTHVPGQLFQYLCIVDCLFQRTWGCIAIVLIKACGSWVEASIVPLRHNHSHDIGHNCLSVCCVHGSDLAHFTSTNLAVLRLGDTIPEVQNVLWPCRMSSSCLPCIQPFLEHLFKAVNPLRHAVSFMVKGRAMVIRTSCLGKFGLADPPYESPVWSSVPTIAAIEPAPNELDPG